MVYEPVKGFRDRMPREAAVVNYVCKTAEREFQNLGFLPIRTPHIEAIETLVSEETRDFGTSGEVFSFQDRGERNLGLRYDQTKGLIRAVARGLNTGEITLPVRLSQIGSVFRQGPVGASRQRGFIQADGDIFGVKEPYAEAEIIAAAYRALHTLEIDTEIRLNDIRLFQALFYYAAVEPEKQQKAITTMDKLPNTGERGVRGELVHKVGLTEYATDLIMGLLAAKDVEALRAYARDTVRLDRIRKTALERLPASNRKAAEGMRLGFPVDDIFSKLNDLQAMLRTYGVKAKIAPSLARGLDYYTGAIFEFFPPGGDKAIAGGGRYDTVMRLFGKREVIPATGLSLGVERIVDLLIARGVEIPPVTQAYLIPVMQDGGEEEKKRFYLRAIEIAEQLRKAGIATEVDFSGASVKSASRTASKRGVPYALYLGPEELEQGTISMKILSSHEQQKGLSMDVLIERLKHAKPATP
ncbi:histidine--tRNA ligase [Candidatus Woesearchaeota archaeon]|nr:histidine--tRNA ligase [Candidatus Woesearchaeota archaeon]